MPPLTGEIERLLIVCPSWVGDTVMATPVLRAVRAHAPRARIVALVRPGLEALLAGCPWIDAFIAQSMKGLGGPWHAARAIRAERPQGALLLPNSLRSALTVRLAGVPVRVGYRRDGRGPLLTHALPVDHSPTPTPTSDYYARLGAWACGLEAFDTTPQLAVTPEERGAADAVLGELADAPLLVLIPGGNKLAKRWPPERFARVADALHDSHGLAAVVSGSPGEVGILSEVVEKARTPIVNLSDRGVDLATLKSVLDRASLLVTNDTGPRHIAAALGTPTVALFGPTDHRWTTLPVWTERILIAEPFLPSETTADQVPDTCVIERIAVEDVIHAGRSLLQSTGSPAEAPR